MCAAGRVLFLAPGAPPSLRDDIAARRVSGARHECSLARQTVLHRIEQPLVREGLLQDAAVIKADLRDHGLWVAGDDQHLAAMEPAEFGG